MKVLIFLTFSLIPIASGRFRDHASAAGDINYRDYWAVGAAANGDDPGTDSSASDTTSSGGDDTSSSGVTVTDTSDAAQSAIHVVPEAEEICAILHKNEDQHELCLTVMENKKIRHFFPCAEGVLCCAFIGARIPALSSDIRGACLSPDGITVLDDVCDDCRRRLRHRRRDHYRNRVFDFVEFRKMETVIKTAKKMPHVHEVYIGECTCIAMADKVSFGALCPSSNVCKSAIAML